MTTYAYKLTLDEGESITLEAALELMIDHCEKQLAEGNKTPYYAHKSSAQKILDRLYSNVQQTSGNNFFK